MIKIKMTKITEPTVATGGVDLHVHSNASDGKEKAEALVLTAIKSGLRVLAITNHNVMDPMTSYLQEKYNSASFRLISAIELGARHVLKTGTIVDVHIKGLFIDPNNPQFQALLLRYKTERIGYLKEILRRLEKLDIFISYEEVREAFPETLSLGRVHIANVAVSKGYARSVDEFMDTYIGKMGQRLCYVDAAQFMNIPTMQEVVEVIRAAHGMADLAHLLYCTNLNMEETIMVVADFKEYAGDCGCMEVYYRDYTPEQVALLAFIAKLYDLIPSCGSDYHGFYHSEQITNYNYQIFERIEAQHQKIYAAE